MAILHGRSYKNEGSHECLRRSLRSLKEVINGDPNQFKIEKRRFCIDKKHGTDFNQKQAFQNSVYLSTPPRGGVLLINQKDKHMTDLQQTRTRHFVPEARWRRYIYIYIYVYFCVFLFFLGALKPLPSDRARREDSNGMDFIFWDALGPELWPKTFLDNFCFRGCGQ